jgi:transcriptional regulator with XRE-family HTH domain
VEDKSQDTPGRNSGDHELPAFGEEIASRFATRFRMLREMGGVTQQQIADRLAMGGHKMHRSAIAKIESGDRPVLLAEAVMLARVLNIDLIYFLADEDDESAAERERLMEAKVAASVADWEVFTRQAALAEAQVLLEKARERQAEATEHVLKLTGAWKALGLGTETED